MLGRLLPWNHLALDFCVFGVFIIDSISLLVIALFKFSAFLYLVGYMFLGIYLVLWSCPNCLYIDFHNILLQLFVFLWWCYFSTFISDFIWWIWLEVYQFCWSFQRTSSWFQWSVPLFFLFVFVFFLVSIWFLSALIFISFLLLVFSFLFLAPSDIRLGCLRFFLLLEVGLYCHRLTTYS